LPHRDDCGRAINYLRVSVTDRCNLRCIYCMPEKGIAKRSHADVLRYEELERIVRAAAELGICKVRLTGGEPLARLGMPEFVRMIASLPGIDDLSMTTNGTLLARHAPALTDAGLHRVNISLDTLQHTRFQEITRRGRLDDVWTGMDAARAVGLQPIKLNMVVVRGLNEDEVSDFARLTLSEGWHVRYIEMMPIGANVAWAGDGVVPVADIRARIEAEVGPLSAVHGPKGNGPARYYQLPGAEGTIGFIGALNEHFCVGCNRLRLTADGELRPCLMSEDEIDLRTPLRAGADTETLKTHIKAAIRRKPQRHRLGQAPSPQDRTMAEIGGEEPGARTAFPVDRGLGVREAVEGKLTHLDEDGRARMVDVGAKPDTERVAMARGRITMAPKTLEAILLGNVKKGDVLTVAQVAGIQAAKRTHELIPMCHPLLLTHVAVEFRPGEGAEAGWIDVQATVRTTGKTGVEMEALTAVSVAALAVYDMCKAVDRSLRINAVRLVRKSGGRSGDWGSEDE
jgi:cyclic pyranopterin phosphate synthase